VNTEVRFTKIIHNSLGGVIARSDAFKLQVKIRFSVANCVDD